MNTRELTKNIIQLCDRANIRHLIFMSSSGVLGETSVLGKEDMKYNPKTLYEKSKMECEKLVIGSGLNYTIVRRFCHV